MLFFESIAARPGAGPFNCEEPQVLGQSCRAPCESGVDAVITCEEQGWQLQDECPAESYLLAPWIFEVELPKGCSKFEKSSFDLILRTLETMCNFVVLLFKGFLSEESNSGHHFWICWCTVLFDHCLRGALCLSSS